MIFFTQGPQIEPPLIQQAVIETIEAAKPKPTDEKEETKTVTWRDNPQGCDESIEYIAEEEPFYCIPKPVESVVFARTTNSTTPRQTTITRRPVSSGNTYLYGYCTHFVKEQLSWVPNGLGNAVSWINGLNSTANPKVGMVAWQGGWVGGGYGHVAVVTAVNGNMVTVSEKNYTGWNIVSTRTVHVSEFTYLY